MGLVVGLRSSMELGEERGEILSKLEPILYCCCCCVHRSEWESAIFWGYAFRFVGFVVVIVNPESSFVWHFCFYR